MRHRQRLAHPVDEPVPAAPRDRVALARSTPTGARRPRTSRPPGRRLRPTPARPARVISDQVCGWCQWTQAPPYSSGDPCQSARPGSPAEPVTGLEQQHLRAAQRRLARRGDAGEPAADDDHVVHATLLLGPQPARRPGRAGARWRRPPRRRAGPASTGLSSSSVERLFEQDLADALREPRRPRARRRTASPRPPVEQAARPAATADGALDPRRVGRQRHDRHIAQDLGPHAAEPDHERRHDRVARAPRRSARPPARPSARPARSPPSRRRERLELRVRGGDVRVAGEAEPHRAQLGLVLDARGSSA